MVVGDYFDTANARKALAEVGTQMVELASKSLARHVEYNHARGDTLDIRIEYPYTLRTKNHLKFLSKCDRIPAVILLNTIVGHKLRGYLSGEVVKVALGGLEDVHKYEYLDILAVGGDLEARNFSRYLRTLATNKNPSLSFGNFSRNFEITTQGRYSSELIYENALDNISLFARPGMFTSGSNTLRLCVLTDEAYQKMNKPFEEREEKS